MSGAPETIRAAPLATRTTCPYCGVGCGVLAARDGDGAHVSGDPAHPSNFGRLCSKGSALGETVGLDGRLLYPMRRANHGFSRVSWDAALEEAARGFSNIIERHGPDAVALYLSGQLLTEDYYVANKLMKGFIGSANVDTNSRLCMASSVAGHKRAFGADTVPGCYEDLDEADLIVLVGSNAAWCHPILFQRILRNKEERGARIIVVDTRRTATAESADLFLQLSPGCDQALFSGLLAHLARTGALRRDFIDEHTEGFETALASAIRLTPAATETAALTGIDESAIARFFDMFARTERTVTLFSQGVNQSAQGSDKVNAILNCHLATGRIGKAGAGPFSLTGQPNAMGGREVGGLANSLAAHMGFEPENVDRLRRFWNAPRMATREGLKAVDMFDAIAKGKIKALWIVGTNPAASLPDANAARAAMEKLELLIVSDNVLSNDTINSGAHILLPARAWGEKNGTVTNSERRMSRQRAFLPPPGEARADWRIFADFARNMGFRGFHFRSVSEVFREHAALSAFENDGARDFDIGGLAGLSDEAYDAMEPTQWPFPAGAAKGASRLFGDGRFFRKNGRAAFVTPATPALATQLSQAYPLRLNTGRIRDQWHTMTRTGASPRLARHLSEPFIEINPRDAAACGLADNGFARVSTAYGACVLRVITTDRQPEGHIFAPIHWTDETATQARIGSLTAPFADPLSGQPEMKATPAAVEPHDFASEGFLLVRRAISLPKDFWWTRIPVNGGFAYRLASDVPAQDWPSLLIPRTAPDLVEFSDPARRLFRAAVFVEDRADFVLHAGGGTPSWDAAIELFALDRVEGRQRLALLSPRAAGKSEGPTVCACFGVGAARIETAIKEGCRSAKEIGAKLRAGTNCGSCLPEIARMLSAGR
ncbi:molybdopterin-dependent oxidoreductase [Methylocystis parvus]|uniref:nitrate reductase n=1 Tax=Methylocystis parvus TaxID=134 RepID=UPI003C77FCF8